MTRSESRVLLYVPPSARAAERQRRVAREALERAGHRVVGLADRPAEVRAALAAGVADRVAVRCEHVADLVPWLLVAHDDTSGVA